MHLDAYQHTVYAIHIDAVHLSKETGVSLRRFGGLLHIYIDSEDFLLKKKCPTLAYLPICRQLESIYISKTHGKGLLANRYESHTTKKDLPYHPKCISNENKKAIMPTSGTEQHQPIQ